LKESISMAFENLWVIIQAVWIVASTWFDEKVVQPIKKFFEPIVEAVKGFFTTLWEDIKTVWDKVSSWFDEKVITPVKNAFEKCVKKIGEWFTGLWTGIKSGVRDAFNAAIGAVETAINWFVTAINRIFEGINSLANAAAKITGLKVNVIPSISPVALGRISAFASGGFPVPGQLFIANEPGLPEMVGQIGNRTAVANNDQIVEAVSRGVFEAVSAAMRNGGNNDRSISLDVYLDGRQLDSAIKVVNNERGEDIFSGGALFGMG